MTKVSKEKFQQVRDIFDNASNFYDAPPVIRDFWMRMAEEKVPHLFTQNLS